MGNELIASDERERARAMRRPEQAPQATRRRPATVIQTKLTVGSANDPLEREADAVAKTVLRRLGTPGALPMAASPSATTSTETTSTTSAGRMQRAATAATEADAATAPGHGMAGGDAEPDIARRVQRSAGGGRPLEADVRDRMQRGFGADFSGVRVHADAEAGELSRSLNARAFTTGSDIYFGTGQYQPGTSSGDQLLAHELTHTLQQSSSRVQRSASPAAQVHDDRSDHIRRWDLKNGVDVSQAQKIRTIETGQAVFMLKDNTGEEIVIKAENYPLGLMKLATLVHQSVHEVEIIDSHAVDASQKSTLTAKIGSADVTSDPSWATLGAGPFAGYKADGDDNATAGRKGHQAQIAGLEMQAQAFAKGEDAKKAAKSTDKVTGLRAMLTSPKYMRQLGSAAAADMFTGNADRVGGIANLGNWVATADQRVQLIDNMDNNAKNTFVKDGEIFGYDMQDWGKNPDAFYADAIQKLLWGAEREGDATIVAWADADGGFTRRFMTEDYKYGFEQAVQRIIKLYGTDKGKKAGRAVKAEVKALENTGFLDYWEVLKARARYMQNPSKGKALQAQVSKRQAAADKKAAKRKK